MQVGVLKGQLFLYDSLGKAMKDGSGVTIQIEGTSFSAISSQNGEWVISGLPTRTYSIAFIKEGFDTVKDTDFRFVSGGTGYLGRIYLQQKIVFGDTLDAFVLSQTSIAQPYIYYHHSINTPDSINLRSLFYLGKHAHIDPNDRTSYSYSFEEQGIKKSGSLDDSAQIYQEYLYQHFSSGDSIYMKVYVGIFPTFNTYFDVNTISDILTGFGMPSNVLSGIIP